MATVTGTDREQQLIRWRREFHLHPEPGFCEFRSASTLIHELETLGYRVIFGADAMDASAAYSIPTEQVAAWHRRSEREGVDPAHLASMAGGYTAVVAELAAGPGPTVALRFDMDALPVLESQAAEHRPCMDGHASLHDGYMHACGHDGHMAIGLGVAAALGAARQTLAGTVRLLFQPAEEGARGGAAAIAARGFLDDVDDLLCCHLGLEAQDNGLIVCRTDFMATSKYRVTFAGEGAHVVNAPQSGRNALLAAAAAALALHAIAPTSRGWFSLNVGVLRAGTEQGITPAAATMELGFWAANSETQEYVRERMTAILHGIAAAWNVDVTREHIGEAPSAPQSEELAAIARRVAETTAGVVGINDFAVCRAGEDATVLIRRVTERGGRGIYVLIGSKLADGHHTPRFDFDESSLRIGVDLLAGIAGELLQRGPLR